MAEGFDRVATVYRTLEHLAYGRQLERARLAHLSALHHCRNILIVGDGDGRCLEALVAVAPAAAITSVDVSPAMLALAQARVPSARGRVTFRCADVRTTPLPEAVYDAVLTMFVLDCFPADEAAAVVQRLGAAAAPAARWLFADFAVPAGGWRRAHARWQVAALYAFFRWQTGIAASRLPPSEALIEAAGFRPIAVSALRAGSIRSVLFSRSPA